METKSGNLIKFTSVALAEIQRLQQELNISDEQYLRVGVKGGGCGGVSYLLAFDKIEPEDVLYEIEGIRVIVNKSHSMHIAGMEIDYENQPHNKGFVFGSSNLV